MLVSVLRHTECGPYGGRGPLHLVGATFASIYEDTPLLVFSGVQNVIALWAESQFWTLAFCDNSYSISRSDNVVLISKGIS